MTDYDIVKRLRARGHWVTVQGDPLDLTDTGWRIDPLCAEAADEIERLRADVFHALDLYHEAEAAGDALRAVLPKEGE